jgi:Type IV pilus assembly protein PilM
MRWRSWLPRARPRRLSVVGLDVGVEACSLVVLTGTTQQPDSVCCAERLHLPEGLVANAEVLQSHELGLWLRAYLDLNDYQPEAIYMGLDSAMVSNHLVTLAAGLSPTDVAFQLQAEVQTLLPPYANDVCIDYSLDTAPSPAGTLRYVVQAAPRLAVEALQRVAQAADLKLLAIEPRYDAARRTQMNSVLSTLPKASVALALQCDEAFGLALRAWGHAQDSINFLPHREASQHLLRRAWLIGVAVCAMGGAFLAAGFAMVITSAAETKHKYMGDVVASARAYEDARLAHSQAQTAQARMAEQARWLQARQALQSQSLQWSRVLTQSAQGVWVGSVKQQGTRWTVQGEALSSRHAQQLVQQLKALDIWAQAPALPQLQVMPAVSTTGLPVWQFRIEADLKVGV